MRILIVCQYFWPENFRINDLALSLHQRGHEVEVLTGIPNYPEGKFFSGYGFFKKTRQDYQGVKVIRVPLIPRGKSSNLRLILNYLSFVFFGVLIAPFVCRGKYDAVFVYETSPILMAIPAILLKKIRKMPLILYVLDLWPESISAVGAIKSPTILNGVSKIVRFIYKHCDQILVTSPGFIDRVKAHGVEESRINYWPQWAEDHYQIIPKEKVAVSHDEMPVGFCIMFAGNIGAAQGFETIIEAADQLKNHPAIHWVILGDGRMKPWVEEQIRLRKLENTVHLLGRHPMEMMSHYFALADVLLVSLKKDPIFALTIPAKVQSYMACGRPILACLDGAGALVVEEAEAGVSCPADNHELLVEAVLKMFNLTDSQRKEMGLRGRTYFEKHFARNILLLQLEQWMENLSQTYGRQEEIKP